MDKRQIWIFTIGVGIMIAAAIAYVKSTPPKPAPAVATSSAPQVADDTAAPQSPPQTFMQPSNNIAPAPMPSPAQPQAGISRPRPQRPAAGQNQNQPAAPADNGLARPDARTALALVGADPDAEKVWANAINDPNVPDDERKNLIEDLNEDGLSDPANPTKADLPLILARIALIQQMGPNAMDDINMAAFKEAYKDLTKMAADLSN